jgi:nicotinate-nucleotide pyrophosphorylase (carboxylating)
MNSPTLLSKAISPQILMERAIELAITEDLGAELHDVTTDAIIADDVSASGFVYLKEPGLVVGLEVMDKIFRRFDNRIDFVPLVDDAVYTSQIPTQIAKFIGPAAPILKAERLALNILQRMSGIATVTRRFVQKAAPFGIEILDTRKTTPCLRAFEKMAVQAAGGTNHRIGLYDAILIKDNHVRLAGSTTRAIQLARRANPGMKIEIETTSLEEVTEAIECKAERIMLDNMSPEMIRQAVELIAGRAYIEVSGGVNLTNIDKYLIAGVNGISVGALTHSAPSLDISLEVEKFI